MSFLDTIGKQAVERLKNNILNVTYNGIQPANNTGKLLNSVRYVATENRVTLFAEDYVIYVAGGRKAGKYPPYNPNDTRYGYKTKGVNKGKPRGTFPNIADWVETKAGVKSRLNFENKSDSQKAGIVWAIADGIKVNGTIIAQKGGSDMLSSVIDESFAIAVRNEISGILEVEFKSIIGLKITI
jgi:hypothetical protein